MSKLAHSSDFMDEIEFRASFEESGEDWSEAIEAYEAEPDTLVQYADNINKLADLEAFCEDRADADYPHPGLGPIPNREMNVMTAIKEYREANGQFGVGA
jgi:hypothetical protein